MDEPGAPPAPEGWPPSGLPPPVTLGCSPLCPDQPRLPPSLTLPTSQETYPGRFWGLRPPPDPGLLLHANAGEPARRSPIYRCRENTPFPWFRSCRPTCSHPTPQARRRPKARPFAPKGRSGAHPKWPLIASRRRAPSPNQRAPRRARRSLPSLPIRANPAIRVSLLSASQHVSVTAPCQASGKIGALSCHSRITALIAFTLLLPPPPRSCRHQKLHKRTGSPETPSFCPAFVYPSHVTGAHIYTIRQASTATRTSPTFPRAIPRFTVKPADQRTTPRSWRQPQQSARCPSPLPGSRFHSPFPPIRCHCRKPPATPHHPGRSGRMFPTPFRKYPRTIRTHLFHSIQIKNKNFSHFS